MIENRTISTALLLVGMACFAAVTHAQTADDESSLGSPQFDPYENSSDAPGTPSFDAAGSGLGAPPNRPWFGEAYSGTNDNGNQDSIFDRTRTQASDLLRFAESPRIQYGWINGGSGEDIDIGELETSVMFSFPNFLQTERPLLVAPTFGLQLWAGPENIPDLPGSAYSGALATRWYTDPTARFSVDAGLTVGVYTDFQTLTSDSLRLTGHGIFAVRLSDDTKIKLGVEYLDRMSTKMLPAAGVTLTPNDMTRLDLYFPRPKISQYFGSMQTMDVWWYASGEYGGGSWTIKRDAGFSDQIDINDLRLNVGFEFGLAEQLRAGNRNGFLELGIVFDREVIFRRTPIENFSPGSTFMIRAGFGY